MSQSEHTEFSQTDTKIIGEFPCTQTQLRFWVLDQFQPGNPSLNVAVQWEIRGTFRPATIEAAFRKIIQRHEILRTRFVERHGSPYQQVLDSVEFKMSVIDLRHMPADQREQRISSIGQETASAPFDLARGGLFRVTLLMVESKRAFILITAHHICFDGWSIRVLGRELGEIASAIDEDRALELPQLPLQYGDFALWQNEYMSSHGFTVEADFWKAWLNGAPYFELPTDFPRPTVRSTNSKIIAVVKPKDFGDRLQKAARDHRVSLYAYGASIISVVLHRFTGMTDIMFDTQIAGRAHSDLEPMIGVFINNLVMRLPVEPQCTFENHLKRSAETVMAAVNHQQMPFNKLVELLNPVRDQSRTPLVSVNFNQSKAFLEDRRYGSFELISAPSQSPGAIYDISFSMVGRPSGWRMSIEYNTDLYDEKRMNRMLELWQEVYDEVLDDPTGPLVRNASLIEGKTSTLPRTTAEPFIRTQINQAQEVSELTRSDLSQNSEMASEENIRRRVTEIWAEVLDLSIVAPNENFFALGGHSLAAVRMISRARDSFGMHLSLSDLFKAPTLTGFAQSIIDTSATRKLPRPASGSSPWSVTPYRIGTGTSTVYTLNHPFHYHRLANVLDSKVSVYNINMFGSSAEETTGAKSLETVARQVVEAMNVDAHSGRVSLVGLCVNGVLAMEVARQLRAAGVDVGLTAMIDSWAPGYFLPIPRSRRRLMHIERRVRRMSYFTRKLLGRGIKPLRFLKEFRITRQFLTMLGFDAVRVTPDEVTTTRVIDFLARAAQSYCPQSSGELALFRSQASPAWAKTSCFGWEATLVGDAKVIDLEGWHEDSLNMGGVHKLAAVIESRLLAERA